MRVILFLSLLATLGGMAAAGAATGERLWRRTMAVSPSANARVNLAAAIPDSLSDEKRELLVAALEESPTHIPGRMNLGNYLILTGDTLGGLYQYQLATWMAPKQALPRLALSQAYEQTGRYGEAALQADTAVMLNPANTLYDEWRILTNLRWNVKHATDLYLAGEFAAAIDACQRALALDSTYALAYVNLCVIYRAMGDWDRAIAAGEKAVELNPDVPRGKANLESARRHEAPPGRTPVAAGTPARP